MSYCTFLAADFDLPEKAWPETECPLEINADTGTIYDGDSDDAYALSAMDDARSFTKKKSAVALCWNYYTEGRARQIIDYIKKALLSYDTVEIWRVWLASPTENLSPSVEARTVPVDQLSPNDMQWIDDADPFSGAYHPHPVYYCLKVVR